MEARSILTSALRTERQVILRLRTPLLILLRSLRGALRDESFAAVYFTAGGDHASDGRHLVGGIRRLPATSGFRLTAGRLPHDTSADVLSGRQSGSDGFFGHWSTGTAIRGNTRAEPDDLDEFIRQLDYYFAIRVGLKHRYCRTGSASGD